MALGGGGNERIIEAHAMALAVGAAEEAAVDGGGQVHWQDVRVGQQMLHPVALGTIAYASVELGHHDDGRDRAHPQPFHKSNGIAASAQIINDDVGVEKDGVVHGVSSGG